MRSKPDQILPTYEREARVWANRRDKSLWEKPILEACVAGREPRLDVLDLGCGSGQPIAQWFVERGDSVTGVDGAAAMVAELRDRVPAARAICADMRTLDLGQTYDIILAFNSFFHLSEKDQQAMFPIFATHAAAGARLVFTSGPSHGEVWGRVGSSEVYHMSLAPDAYRALLADHGFTEIWFRPDDPDLNGHSVWLAEFTGV
ncbi:trans-aconitate 2-methyltransferase [Gymnodinialimonas hymeniacidonis]|uniref:class I SAM-dependent methyltransferase n=1 Tax=Gymnodinialimonas hymeniacidonis TaxID=3126508 RepID=UPI0034C5B46B